MKRIQLLKRLAIWILPCCLVAACEKDDRVAYQDGPGIYFFTDSSFYIRDSLTYSFAVKQSTRQADTIKIPVKLMGIANNKDYSIPIEVVAAGTTAVEGEHYQILPSSIKAGKYTDSLSIKVMKTADLDNTTVRLNIRIAPTAGYNGGVKEKSQYSIKLNNILSKPANWDGLLVLFFGNYSKRKFQFIIDNTGISEFNFLTPVGSADFQYYTYMKQALRAYLTQYEATNGPLLDETGDRITFPA